MAGPPSASFARNPWLVVIAASYGGIAATSKLLRTLAPDLPAAVVVVQHRKPGKTHLEAILSRYAPMPVVTASGGDLIMPGVVYVARPDLHLVVGPDKRFAYSDGHRIRYVLSSANPLLETAATAFGGRLIAVVLTGLGSDATDGVQTVKAHGGVIIVQDRASSEKWDMPTAALKTGVVDYVLPLDAIGPAINAIVEGQPIAITSSYGTHNA